MNISIEPFTLDRIEAVKEFNRRMMAGGLDRELAFPETPFLDFPVRDAPIWQEPFLAIENGVVRGAYYLTHEKYCIRDEVCGVAHYRHPISEVVINKAYRGLGSRLLEDATRRQPLLYATVGGERNPNLRRLRAEGWSDAAIPFRFRVVRPSAFFSNLAFFRKTAMRRLLFDAAARTGAGWLGVKALQILRSSGGDGLSGYSVDLQPEFGPWADELWEVSRPLHLLAAVRDRATLNLRYSPENPRFQRLAVSHNGRVAGWCVLIDKRMKGNPYFGDMHVGTLVDCLAAPGHENAVAPAAASRLEAAGVDIVVTNQSSGRWNRALRTSGFLSGPSNYHFACSPELARRLSTPPGDSSSYHVNRGDGAGISRL